MCAATAVDLTPFVARGRRLCDARSVLYRTPRRAALTDVTKPDLHVPTEELFSNQDASVTFNLTGEYNQESTQNDGINNDMCAEILEGLSGLSDTLCSALSEVTIITDPTEGRRSKIGASLRLRRSPRRKIEVPSCSAISPSLGSQVVSTTEREADLDFLEEK